MFGKRIKVALYRKGLLVRVTVIAIFVAISVALAAQGGLQTSLLLGACIGTIVSITVTWLISFLENPEIVDVPLEFVAAAKTEVNRASYYRQSQRIWINIELDKDKSEIIVLEFASLLIPTNDVADVHCPDIGPPDGTALKDFVYKVDGRQVPADQYREISRTATDNLKVRYRILDKDCKTIFDDHLWPCPVLGYNITFAQNKAFNCTVSRKVAGTKTQALIQQKNDSRNEVEFFGHGAAFTRQGIRWRIERM